MKKRKRQFSPLPAATKLPPDVVRSSHPPACHCPQLPACLPPPEEPARPRAPRRQEIPLATTEPVVEERPQRVLAEALVETVEDVLGQERRDAAEGANVEDLHVVGEAVAEVEEERVLVPGEVPATVVRAALAAHGESVFDDDEAVDGERGDAAGGVLVELRKRPRCRHSPLL
jgi:hypothetical protein